MHLNPKKCIFGVTSEKSLGYLVSSQGIEANPVKIVAFINMRSMWYLKEIQQLNGRIAALSRFVSKYTENVYLSFIS